MQVQVCKIILCLANALYETLGHEKALLLLVGNHKVRHVPLHSFMFVKVLKIFPMHVVAVLYGNILDALGFDSVGFMDRP